MSTVVQTTHDIRLQYASYKEIAGRSLPLFLHSLHLFGVGIPQWLAYNYTNHLVNLVHAASGTLNESRYAERPVTLGAFEKAPSLHVHEVTCVPLAVG